eukprot:TRINITY_DN33516_c0_g1_i1.p1 TRINITY_DN33516_c0_g1~~TRINITY_DN33516_c0_g1_i1.p1  ORF type:complete len:388 (+),score=76.69 TRINITY_DN33516_c0_g1_i1:42-1205(+)
MCFYVSSVEAMSNRGASMAVSATRGSKPSLLPPWKSRRRYIAFCCAAAAAYGVDWSVGLLTAFSGLRGTQCEPRRSLRTSLPRFATEADSVVATEPDVKSERAEPVSLAHRASRQGAIPKGAAAAASYKTGSGEDSTWNAKVRLNNRVAKLVRRSLLSGDVRYQTWQFKDNWWFATVNVLALAESEDIEREFNGTGRTEQQAERAAAKAALKGLPAAPDMDARYPKPKVAAAWVQEQLEAQETVELDTSTRDMLTMLASIDDTLGVVGRFSLEDDFTPCRLHLWKEDLAHIQAVPSEDIRVVQVGGRTVGSKLGQSLRARILGEGERAYKLLELRMVGNSAMKEAAVALKILQRFLPEESGKVAFTARFETFEGYRKQGLKVHVWTE